MDFYNLIKKLPYSEIEKIVRSKISQLEIKSNISNKDKNYIGFDLDYNPRDYHLNEKELKFNLDIRNIHIGYINKGMQINYGIALDNRGIASNDGKYYYVDDDSYIYDFCNYIKEKEVKDEYHLFDYILKFIRNYFGVIRNNDREEMHQMICKEDRVYLDPINIHKFSDFYKKGNAMCTEIALMAENILSMFGFNTYYVVGNIRIGDEKDEFHAYNLIKFKEKETNDEMNGIIDFSSYTDVFNINYEKIGEKPYIVFFDEINKEFLDRMLYEEESITYEDYDFVMLDTLVEMKYDRDREYYISDNFDLEKVFEKKKI